MAKRASKASRPADAGQTTTTTTTTMEPSAPAVADLLSALEPSADDVAVPQSAVEPSAADVAVPLSALDPPVAVSPTASAATATESAPKQRALGGGTTDVESTIGQVTRLYRAITGLDVFVSNTPYAPIPAEKDPVQHVEQQLDRLMDVLTAWRARHLGAARSVSSR
jgi:hypothetical protein